jgi:hypothetical protein
VAAEQMAFARQVDGETVVVLLNAADLPNEMAVPAPGAGVWRDLLNGGAVETSGGQLRTQVPASWGRVLRLS